MKWIYESERLAFYRTWQCACHILCNHRWWFKRERDKHALHPVVEKAMSIYRPVDWQQLLIEWPHKAEDGERVAYTQNERKGADDVQTVTSVGKYLRRHFDMPDHELRDIVALYDTSGHTLQFVHTTDEMVRAVREGPHSCMSNRFGNLSAHPYAVYKPEYGWHMAVRKNGDSVDGRALCLHDEDDGPVFVRSYKRCPNGGYSHADEKLEAWLKDQGYTKLSGWPVGAKVARIEQSDQVFLMPYIDGDNRGIDEHGSHMTIESSGDYDAATTDGCIGDNRAECEDCGHMHDEDDSYWVGRWADRRIGPCCIDDNYRHAYGRGGDQYYESEDECVYCDDDAEWYVIDYLGDNDMIQLRDGNITHTSNAVFIESCDEYYHTDDDSICYAEDTERYELREDCWCCASSGNYYTNDTDFVEVDGETYHPNHAPETNETQGEE